MSSINNGIKLTLNRIETGRKYNRNITLSSRIVARSPRSLLSTTASCAHHRWIKRHDTTIGQLTIALASRKLVVHRLTIPPTRREGWCARWLAEGKERITGPCTAPSNAHSILPKPLIIDRDYCVSSATTTVSKPPLVTSHCPAFRVPFSYFSYPRRVHRLTIARN